MSNVNTLRDRVAAIFSSGLHLDVPSHDLDLFETGVLDSLTLVELLLRLEREFGVTTTVDDLDVATFRSIESIADFVHARVGDGALTGSLRVVRVAAGH